MYPTVLVRVTPNTYCVDMSSDNPIGADNQQETKRGNQLLEGSSETVREAPQSLR